MPQLERVTDCFRRRAHKAINALAIVIAILALFLLVSAKDVQMDLSRDVSLNITQSLFKLTDGGADYFVQVKNEGQVLLKNVRVMDALPPGLVNPRPCGTNGLPLLICIEHDIYGNVKNLTWYLENIDTGQNRWINFSVQMVNPSANPSLHVVRANGTAFEYLIEATPLTPAVRYFGPDACVVETKAKDAFLAPLPKAITEAENSENASIVNEVIKTHNESELF